MTDEEIIRLFFERSEQAIAELSKAHGSTAARVARNILGSERDAEECLNDTYLAVFNQAGYQVNSDVLCNDGFFGMRIFILIQKFPLGIRRKYH